jgi:hypothetical protein
LLKHAAIGRQAHKCKYDACVEAGRGAAVDQLLAPF